MDQFEEIVEAPQLHRQLRALVAEYGGFREMELDFLVWDIDFRHSPIAGRYSVTLSGPSREYVYYYLGNGLTDHEEERRKITIKFEPEAGVIYSVIPWRAIMARWERIERSIREFIVSCQESLAHDGGDPELDQLLLEEAIIELREYARKRPIRARELAEELGVELDLSLTRTK